MLQVGPSLVDGCAVANPRRKQMGVAATPSRGHKTHDGVTYHSCCVSDAITNDDQPNIGPSSAFGYFDKTQAL